MNIPNEEAFQTYHERRKQRLADWDFALMQSILRRSALRKVAKVILFLSLAVYLIVTPSVTYYNHQKVEKQKELLRETIGAEAVRNVMASARFETSLTTCPKCHRHDEPYISQDQYEAEYERLYLLKTGREADYYPTFSSMKKTKP